MFRVSCLEIRIADFESEDRLRVEGFQGRGARALSSSGLHERDGTGSSSSSSLLLSSLELSDTKSMSLKYEPSSEPLHISVKDGTGFEVSGSVLRLSIFWCYVFRVVCSVLLVCRVQGVGRRVERC